MIDFSKPMFTVKDDTPVHYICADVVEIKRARVCVDKETGIVYSSPYNGIQIYNKE